MGLLSKEVYVIVNSTSKHYESKGYKIPKQIGKEGKEIVKRDAQILVKVEDLTDGSRTSVEIQCDGCETILTGVRWVDYLKCVKEDGKYYCSRCAKAGFKKWISFNDWCYSNLPQEEADKILSRWDYELNVDKYNNTLTPKDISRGSKGLKGKGYWFKCLDHPEHESEQKQISGFTNGTRSMICNQCNSILITHPYFLKFFVNKEDACKYSHGSAKIILAKCPNCGYEKEIKIHQLTNYGFGCIKCSDGISYPEKFIYNLLEQIENLIFKKQLTSTTFEWCSKYRYDFYIEKENCIIEVHGIQHYKDNMINWGILLIETLENDEIKRQLALENKIINYIVLDCRSSNMEWIRNNVMNSDLPILLNFKEEDIDWLRCHEYACKSLVKPTCILWEGGLRDILKIAKELEVGKASIIRYLKQGSKLGWCNYKFNENIPRDKNHKVICLTTGEVFNSIQEASDKYNILRSSISVCCRSETNKSGGKHPVTCEKMVWKYYEDPLGT